MYWVHDYGYKIALIFSNGEPNPKKELINKLAKLIKINGWFVELSDAPDHIIRNKMNITDKDLISKIVGVETNVINDDGTYKRLIGDKQHEKRLFGIPCTTKLQTKKCNRKQICEL